MSHNVRLEKCYYNVGDYIAFNQGVLYIANSSSLYLLDISSHMNQTDKLKIELSKNDI